MTPIAPRPARSGSRRVRRCDERARERRRPRHLPARRAAVGDDRDRVRVGVRIAADGARVSRLGHRERSGDRGDGRVRGQHPLARPGGRRGVRRRRPARRSSSTRSSSPAIARARALPIAQALAHLDCDVVDGGRRGRSHRLLRPRPHGAPPRRRRPAPLPRPRLRLVLLPRTDDRKEPEMYLELTAKNRARASVSSRSPRHSRRRSANAPREHDREASFPLREPRSRSGGADISRRRFPRSCGGLGVDVACTTCSSRRAGSHEATPP